MHCQLVSTPSIPVTDQADQGGMGEWVGGRVITRVGE